MQNNPIGVTGKKKIEQQSRAFQTTSRDQDWQKFIKSTIGPEVGMYRPKYDQLDAKLKTANFSKSRVLRSSADALKSFEVK